jgi:hypothetical protein
VKNLVSVLIAVLLFSLNSSAAVPLCSNLFSQGKLRAKPLAEKIESTVINAPTRDYRMYLYEKETQGCVGSACIRDASIELHAKVNSLEYIHSVSSMFRPAPIAFFKNANGDVFGVSHTELSSENGARELGQIKEIVDQKITIRELDQLFSKDGDGFFRSNLRKVPKTLRPQSLPLLSEPTLKLYRLTSKLRLAIRSYESQEMRIEIVETVSLQNSLNQYAVQHGRAKQTAIIDEVLNFIFPLYAERRGWTQEFIADLRAKAHASADSTKYIVVRDKNTNEILATMGLSRAPFGKALFRDEASQQWREVSGAFGETIAQDGLGPNAPKLNLLDSAVPILPMEKYFGKALLPRPAVFDFVTRAMKDKFGNWTRWFSADNSKKSKFVPAAADPFFSGSGIIYEPTKFGVAKNSESRKIAHAQVIRELFSAVFDLRYENQFLLNGQQLYTYNDKSGIRLYQSMGFKLMSEKPITKDGTDWYLLKLSPKDLIEQMKSDRFGSEAETQLLVEKIQSQLVERLESNQ